MRDVLTFPSAREQWEWGCSRRDTRQGIMHRQTLCLQQQGTDPQLQRDNTPKQEPQARLSSRVHQSVVRSSRMWGWWQTALSLVHFCPLNATSLTFYPINTAAWPRTFGSFLSCPRSAAVLLSLVRLLKVGEWMKDMPDMDSTQGAKEVFAAGGSQEAEVTWAVLKWIFMPSKSRSWKEQGLLLLSTLMSSDNASATQSLSELSLHFNRKGCYFFSQSIVIN